MRLGRLPWRPLSAIDRLGAKRPQDLEHDCLEDGRLARDRPPRLFQLADAHHAVESSRIARANHALHEAFHRRPLYHTW